MARLESLPITLVASIKPGSITTSTFYNNTGSTYHGYGYTFNCTLQVTATLTSDDRITPNQFMYDAYFVNEGMWFGQSTNGASYKIISVSTPTNAYEIDVVLKDVGLYNILSDTSFSGFNTPSEGNNGLLFYLSDDGDPILSGLQLLQPYLPDINYFVNDMYAKFQYRNFTTTHYNNNDINLVYGTGYSINQIVYLNSTGTFQLVDTTNSSQVEKSFGIITSVNEPEDGNMTVKPFGEIKGGLTLTGFSIGDVLYYDATASNTSYVTDIKPTTNPLPIYIKISDTTGSLIGGQTSGGGGTGASGTSGTSGTDGSSGSNGTDGSSGTSGSNGTDGSSGTSGVDGVSGTSGTSGSNGTDGSSGTSGSNGTDGTSGVDGVSGTSGTSGSDGTSGDSLFSEVSPGVWTTTNNILITGSLNVDGTVNARELHVTYETSSVMYTSGSTKFGNTIDDTHQFTGSLFISGSVNITSGSLVIDGVPFSAMTSGTSGSNGTDGSSGSNGSDGSSGTSGVDGVSGTSGTSGSNGTDGSSGSSGISGVDGTDGSSGTSGVDGVSGTSGTSGSNGTDGTSGISGVDGTDGSSGTSGVDGVSGTSGTSGSNGTDGTSGISGVDGTDGTSGDSLFAETGSFWATTNDIQITGSLTVGQGTGVVNSYLFLTDSSSLILTSGSNIIVENGGYITAAFFGDGAGLYNIPASGVTGLNLNLISSGSNTASIGLNGFNINTNTSITGALNVDGIITARQLNIDYVSSSILYTSGSTKFGDTIDDTHEFTGSLFISGSVNISSGSLVIDGVPFSAMTSGTSGSNGTDGTSGSNGTDGSSGSNGTDGSSGTSGVDGVSGTSGTSGSNGTDGSSGSNGTDGSSGSSGISGVDGTDGSSGTSGVDGVSGTSGTSGSNGTDGSSGSSGTSGVDGVSGTSGTSGSNGTDGSSGTSGDSLFSEVTSGVWATTNDVLITGSLFVSNTVYAESGSFNYVHTIYETASVIYGSGSTKFGDTFDDTHTFTGSVNITGSITLNGQAIGTGKLDETVFNDYTSSVTSSFSGTSSYATYALYAENAVIVSGANKQLYVSSPLTTWSFTHNLHERYPVINVFDDNGYIVVPETIRSIDQDKIEVYFNVATAGHVVASVGGAGTSGTSGSNGTDGSSGSSGSNGTDGSSGTSGVDGVSGTSGTSGSNGTDGTSGSSGISGIDGTDGSSGTSGVDGVSGTSGTSGSNGTDGTSGSNGTDGSSGSNGTDGTSGSNGTDGSSGSSGISGIDGTDGSSGTSGVDGVSGTSGTSGSNGTDGSSGSSGTSGVDGVSGTSGTSGSNGTDGTSGSNGTDGSSGTSGDSLFSEVSSGVWTTTNDVLITGSLYVSNTVHAESGSFNYIHTIYETASVIYSSGSTKFGDTFDDTHNFTGSVNITGSITLNGQAVGVGKLDETTFNAYTSSVTSSFSGTSSYAIFAENAVIVSGANKQLYVSSPSTTWSFTHNLHERYPVINVFDSNGYIVVPETIRSVNQDLIEVYFNTPETGHIVASVGGAGTSGTSGSNGTDGSSGSNGTDGSSGTSGSNGTDGSSGSNGTDGTSGSNGTDGSSGSSGISGIDGTDGSSGTSGVDGVSGTSGTSGSNGTDGTSGDSLFAQTGSFWATTNDIQITGSLDVDGIITAREIHTSYVTSSVLYESGSTKFGDTLDDTHQFTGSLLTTGSVTINGDLIVNGTTTLTATDPLRESLIISGAMAMMQAQIQAQIVSASISMQGQQVIFNQNTINIMDLGGF